MVAIDGESSGPFTPALGCQQPTGWRGMPATSDSMRRTVIRKDYEGWLEDGWRMDRLRMKKAIARLYHAPPGKADGRTDGRTDGQTDGRMHERTDGRMHGRTDGRMDGRMERRIISRPRSGRRAAGPRAERKPRVRATPRAGRSTAGL